MAGKKPGFSGGTHAMLLLSCAVFAAALWMLLAGRPQQGGVAADLENLQGLRFSDASPAEMTPPPDEGTPPAAPVAAATPKPEAPESAFTIAAAGAVSTGRSILEFAQERGGYDFSTVFLGFGPALQGADLSLCTLETMTDDRQAYGSANAPAALLDALRGSGFGLLSLATERMLDEGYDGLDVTQLEMTRRALMASGVREAGELPGCILSLGGIRTAILAYTYGLSEEGAARTGGDPRGEAPLLAEEEMVRDIVRARASGAEAVVLLLHWGVKNRDDVPPSVEALAHRLAAAGADIILGTHPGIVQRGSLVKVTRSDGLMYDALICYSLGCLLSEARSEENAAGAVLRISAAYDRTRRRLRFQGIELVPTYVARQEEEGKTAWRIVEAESEAALSALNAGEQEAARRAALRVRAAYEGEEP